LIILATHYEFSFGGAKAISQQSNTSTTLALPRRTPRSGTIGVTLFCRSGKRHHYSATLSFTNTSTGADWLLHWWIHSLLRWM